MSLGYIVREGISGISRTKLAAITSISALIISTLLVGILIRVGFSFYYITNELKSQVEVEVFLKDINDNQRNAFEIDLKSKLGVSNLTYISKDSAIAIFKNDFGTEGSGLASLNFLPASYRIRFTTRTAVITMKEIVDELSKNRYVDEVKFDEQTVNLLETRIRTLGLIGLGLSFFVIFSTLLLVYNTIRLTIYAKQTIIRAMKLVGATNALIRRPFIVEGIIQGFVAGLLSVGFHYVIFHNLIPKVLPQVGVLAWPMGRWFYLVILMVVFGIIIGLIGSRWAAKKFIKAVEISNV